MINDDALQIYTDGSSLRKPLRGGIGYVFVYADDDGEPVVDEHSPPGYKEATSGLMELYACYVALKKALDHHRYSCFSDIVLFTDSQYVQVHQFHPWAKWPSQDWKNRDGKPVKHVEIWRKLKRVRDRHSLRVDIRWVKGHAKNRFNKLADKLAKKSASNAVNPPLEVTSTRRKTTLKETEQGSIKMRGQCISLRIVSCARLPVQKMWAYRCEVISTDSEFFGCIQEIFSVEDMRDGHHYEVMLNDNDKNPTIVEVLRELDR